MLMPLLLRHFFAAFRLRHFAFRCFFFFSMLSDAFAAAMPLRQSAILMPPPSV